MAAVRLILAAIVASASAPAMVVAAPVEPVGWKLGDRCPACEPGLALPCEVRAALARTAVVPLTAAPVIAVRPPIRTAVGIEFVIARAPAPPAVLPDAPKTSPPT